MGDADRRWATVLVEDASSWFHVVSQGAARGLPSWDEQRCVRPLRVSAGNWDEAVCPRSVLAPRIWAATAAMAAAAAAAGAVIADI